MQIRLTWFGLPGSSEGPLTTGRREPWEGGREGEGRRRERVKRVMSKTSELLVIKRDDE